MKPRVIRCGIFTLAGFLATIGSAAADPTLTLSSATLEPGESATLTLNATDLNPAWGGVNATLQLPPGVEVVDVVSDLEPDFDFDFEYDANAGSLSVIVFSDTHALGSSSVEIAELTVSATVGAVAGVQPVAFVTGLSGISDMSGENSISHATSNGHLDIFLAELLLVGWPLALLLPIVGVLLMRGRHRAGAARVAA
jgi:hypothetical protein